jgi:hypothetical protein
MVSAGMMRRTKPVLFSLSLRYWNIFPAGRQVRICSSVVCVPLRRSDALIVRARSARVNWTACESRRKTLQNFSRGENLGQRELTESSGRDFLLDSVGGFIFGDLEIVAPLQIQPEPRRGVESIEQAEAPYPS